MNTRGTRRKLDVRSTALEFTILSPMVIKREGDLFDNLSQPGSLNVASNLWTRTGTTIFLLSERASYNNKKKQCITCVLVLNITNRRQMLSYSNIVRLKVWMLSFYARTLIAPESRKNLMLRQWQLIPNVWILFESEKRIFTNISLPHCWTMRQHPVPKTQPTAPLSLALVLLVRYSLRSICMQNCFCLHNDGNGGCWLVSLNETARRAASRLSPWTLQRHSIMYDDDAIKTCVQSTLICVRRVILIRCICVI